MKKISYEHPRPRLGLAEIMSAILGKDRYPRETRWEKPPRRSKINLTTRGHFINCIA